ncbi:GreA/GreB family elongation factor [Chryseobacterium echinoideorum]|uniref:GreA/GreB family elongation factor n=1 Tax=Chryseobacterium echinoideorum TaxID=1549648 RepID=UPI0011868FDA|nr:GreA/GreB family elongation factor [Chryseobacterium echinoideorum]
MNKQEIIDVLHQKTAEKIQGLEKLIAETRASNNDTKSSMGDKYETGREMLQQQINNLQIQLNEAMKQQIFVKSIVAKPSQKVEKGAVVSTEKGVFFISVSLGEIAINEHKLMCISPESPLAKAMNGKSVNDVFTLNNVAQKIINIE